MEKKDYSAMSDQELLQAARKARSNAIVTALYIGVLIGTIVYSITINKYGFFVLLMLFFVFKLIAKPSEYRELGRVLKERGLK